MMEPRTDDHGNITVYKGPHVLDAPLVSVVIPAYRPTWLDAALDSVRDQTFRNYELIVIDDGSPEPVRPARIDDLVLIRQPNAGPGGARNTGVAYARGSLIAFLDADDRWHPQKLERQVALHARDPELVMSCTALVITDGKEVRPPRRQTQQRLKLGNRVPYSHLFYENCVICSTVMLKRDAYRRTPGMKPHVRLGEDYALWLRIALLGPVGFLPEPLLERRLHEDGLTYHSKTDGSSFEQERAVYQEILDQYPELAKQRFVRRALARVDFQGAWAHIEREEWAQARRALMRSLAYAPLRPKAWLDFARAVFHVGPLRRPTV